MLTASPLVVALGIAALAWVSATLAVILWIKCRKYKLEVRRLVGDVGEFTLSDLDGNPEVIVTHLRNDANICDFAGQGDMAARLRGYASFLDRHFTNRRMADELRKVGTGS